MVCARRGAILALNYRPSNHHVDTQPPPPQVIRHYHGHLSAVYSLSIHPTLDVLCSVGRDSTCRVWDMRTKSCIHTLTGHTNTVSSVLTQATEPQIITASHDTTMRFVNLRKHPFDIKNKRSILSEHWSNPILISRDNRGQSIGLSGYIIKNGPLSRD